MLWITEIIIDVAGDLLGLEVAKKLEKFSGLVNFLIGFFLIIILQVVLAIKDANTLSEFLEWSFFDAALFKLATIVGLFFALLGFLKTPPHNKK
jgi:hypothetical protein